MSTTPIEKLIELHIKAGDMAKEIEREAAAKTKALKEQQKKIEGMVFAHLKAQGLDSVKVRGIGTAFTKRVSSCRVAQWEETLPFIQKHGLWHMLHRAVNKDAVNEYRQQHNGEPPPGVSWDESLELTIRRSDES